MTPFYSNLLYTPGNYLMDIQYFLLSLVKNIVYFRFGEKVTHCIGGGKDDMK